MQHGAAGAIMASKKQNKAVKDKKQVNTNEDDASCDKEQINLLSSYQKNIQKVSHDNELKIHRYPVIAWLFGLSACISGVYLIYYLAVGRKVIGTQLQGFNEGSWWQYLVSTLIILFGLLFLLSVKQEEVIFNKREDSIIQCKKNFFCMTTKKIHRQLSKMLIIEICKKGFKNGTQNSIHYKLIAIFDLQRNDRLEMAESKSLQHIKRTYIRVKTFLNKPIENCGHIIISNESVIENGL